MPLDLVFIRPADGRRVRDPDTRVPLPNAGRFVRWTVHWRRAVEAGDVVLADPPSNGAPAAAEEG